MIIPHKKQKSDGGSRISPHKKICMLWPAVAGVTCFKLCSVCCLGCVLTDNN